MHSYKAEHSTRFHYNSDFSGEVIIVEAGPVHAEVRIPAPDLLQFVARCYVQGRMIDKLEDMPWQELLE